jgi:hypothetical protein
MSPIALVYSLWGPLWLIHKYKGEKVDPTSWLVEFRVPASGAKGTLRLKLKFDGALPALDKWPAQ